VLLVALAAGLGSAVGVTAARRRGSTRGRNGRTARSLALVGTGARVGAMMASSKARQVFADAERKEVLREELQLRSAAEVAATLGNLKGALMKLGQMASYLDERLPAPLREALAQLQADAPPMSAELAAGVVLDELGAPPEVVFAEWDPVPIAAASIGQVHRAMTRDGQAVAVKVQYPGVAEAISADLGTAALLFGSLRYAFEGFDPGPLLGELALRLVEELDYVNEAANQQAFVDAYAGHPFVRVPAVRHDLSTGRVLTTELVSGARFDEVLTWPDAERNAAAEALFRFVFRGLYRFGAFNADPHPGNYLFHGGGQVTFLDFGLVRRFDAHELDVFGGMIRAMVLDPDPAHFRAAVERAGLLRPGADVADDVVSSYFRRFYELVLHDGPFTFTPAFASDNVRHVFDPSSPIAPHATVPASFVFIQRINLGLYAVLGSLRATANWRRIAEELWPFVDGPPSTPMGEAEAAWLRERLAAGPAPSANLPRWKDARADEWDGLESR
jgi:predicted unusual protein kinase regulating ubiquinone biosynthesis (AarF/ABC1/UbiB family)